jgi:hypothetical protein
MFFRMVLVVITLATAQAAYGQQQPAMTMHRAQAGELDSSGWTIVRSTEGGFAVRLPLRFNDFTIADSNPDSPTGKMFIVGAKSAEGVKFTATRITYRKAGGAATYFANIGRGEGLQSKPQSIKAHQLSRVLLALCPVGLRPHRDDCGGSPHAAFRRRDAGANAFRIFGRGTQMTTL